MLYADKRTSAGQFRKIGNNKRFKAGENQVKKSIKFLKDVVKAKSDENERNKEAIQQLMVDKLNLEKIIEKQKNN